MAEILRAVDDPGEAARRLVDVANEHGGADNITVVIVDVQVGEGGAEAPRPRSRRSGSGGDASAAAARRDGRRPGAPVRRRRGRRRLGNHADPSDVRRPAALTADRPTRPCPRARRTTPRRRAPSWASVASQTTLAEDGPRSDEFFFGTATAVPVARATTRVPPTPAPPSAPRSARRTARESRGARRRRLGIPRRVTPRVIGFVLLVAAVPVAAYFVLRWYAYDNWFVTLQGNQIVIKQGQPGGVLWFHPKVVDRTGAHHEPDRPRCGGPDAGGRPGVIARRPPGATSRRHHDHHDDDHHDHDDQLPFGMRPAGHHHDHAASTATTTAGAP